MQNKTYITPVVVMKGETVIARDRNFVVPRIQTDQYCVHTCNNTRAGAVNCFIEANNSQGRTCGHDWQMM